jgi:glycine/D-amino acid oxidase-like deaminating enzyme
LERIRSEDLKRRFPQWNHAAYPDGYFNPKAGCAESGEVVAQLVREAIESGVTIREGISIEGVLWNGSKVPGVRTIQGEDIRSDRVLLAAGAWTPTLLPSLQKAMRSVAQPILYFRPKDPGRYQPPHFPVWAADVSRTGWYGFPANAEGIVKVANHGPGYPMAPDPSNRVAPDEEKRFRTFLRGTFPDLAEAELVESRLCYYCDTWDGHFWIDRDPEHEGLFVAAGGSGHAFKFAPVLGTLIADAVEGKPNPYSDRFKWREPGNVSHAAGRAPS